MKAEPCNVERGAKFVGADENVSTLHAPVTRVRVAAVMSQKGLYPRKQSIAAANFLDLYYHND